MYHHLKVSLKCSIFLLILSLTLDHDGLQLLAHHIHNQCCVSRPIYLYLISVFIDRLHEFIKFQTLWLFQTSLWSLKADNYIKGTSHDFFRSGKPTNHFHKQGKIYQKKYQNPGKTAEIMNKNGFFGNFHSWWHSKQCF